MPKNKGSRPQEELVPIARASRMVGVSTSTIHRMSKRGVLQPLYVKGSKLKHFRIHDISALAEVLQKGKERPLIDLESIAELSMQAYVTARANERRLDDLYHLLGFSRTVLPVDEENVIAVYVRAQEAVDSSKRLSAEEVYEWAGTLYAIDETYLRLIQEHTASEEPWKVFMDLGHQLLQKMPAKDFAIDPQLKTSYVYLSTARNNLRSVSYYYCRQKLGAATAAKVFRHDEDPLEEVCRLMFPSLPHVLATRGP